MRTWLNLLANNIFLGDRKQPDEVYDKLSPDENIKLTTEDNQTVWGLLLKPPTMDENTHCYVVCHGKGTDRVKALKNSKLKAFFPTAGNRCFFFLDYRNFGNSTGYFNFEDVSYDVHAAVKYLQDKYKTKNITMVAHSLGGGVVFQYYKFLKDRKEKEKDLYIPKEAYCFATFSSIMDCLDEFRVYRFLKWIPGVQWLVPGDFAYDNVGNAQHLKDLGVSMVLFHGKQDKTINYKQAEKLRKELKKKGVPTKLEFRADKGHDSLFALPDLWSKVIGTTPVNDEPDDSADPHDSSQSSSLTNEESTESSEFLTAGSQGSDLLASLN